MFLHVDVSQDGTQLFTGGKDRTATLWDTLGKKQKTIKGFPEEVCWVGFSNDPNTGLGISGEKIYNVNLRTGTLSRMASLTEGAIVCARLFSQNTKLVAADSENVAIHDITAFSQGVDSPKLEMSFPEHLPVSLAISPDERFLAIGSATNLRIISLSDGNEVRNFKAICNQVQASDFVLGGKFLAVADETGAFSVIDVAEGSLVKQLNEGREKITSLCVSPNGLYGATGGDEKGIKIWDFTNGTQIPQNFVSSGVMGKMSGYFQAVSLTKPPEFTGVVRSLRFFPDGWRIATAGEDTEPQICPQRGLNTSTTKIDNLDLQPIVGS